MDKETKEILQIILEDADVMDIDFSNWDKYITIVAISDHLDSSYNQRKLPAFKIDFWGVSELNFQFRHHHDNDILDTSKHVQWSVDQFDFSKHNGKYTLEFYREPRSPVTKISFARVTLEEIPQYVLDKVTPDWAEPYTPLARRSIMEIYNKMVGGRKKDSM